MDTINYRSIYTKNINGFVTISFIVKKTGTSDDISFEENIATLPVGFRPDRVRHGFISYRPMSGEIKNGHVAIFPNGIVKVLLPSAAGIYVLGEANFYAFY